jgi:hypothetical protein
MTRTTSKGQQGIHEVDLLLSDHKPVIPSMHLGGYDFQRVFGWSRHKKNESFDSQGCLVLKKLSE